jgi:hypothetical protein
MRFKLDSSTCGDATASLELRNLPRSTCDNSRERRLQSLAGLSHSSINNELLCLSILWLPGNHVYSDSLRTISDLHLFSYAPVGSKRVIAILQRNCTFALPFYGAI